MLKDIKKKKIELEANVFPTFFLSEISSSRCLSQDLPTGHSQSPHLGASQGRETPGEGQSLPCAGSSTPALFLHPSLMYQELPAQFSPAGTECNGGFLPHPLLWEHQQSQALRADNPVCFNLAGSCLVFAPR